MQGLGVEALKAPNIVGAYVVPHGLTGGVPAHGAWLRCAWKILIHKVSNAHPLVRVKEL